MARQKEFDREEALHKAMEVFWSRGYEAASINELVKHMGINRQSLYDTFGDKHALYLQALDRYREVESRKMFDLLERPGSVKKALRELFRSVIEDSLYDQARRGCFIDNAVSELAGRCPETAAKARGQLAEVEEALYQLLLRGKENGELNNGRDFRALARFLCSNLQGLQLLAKATQDRKTLEDVVKVTLSLLE
ncbi:MAG TPA: TetR/AcrR family transcriptional regulator [Candidatus Angelobacter sp.]|nr:TetR/AcrR family transcriptional regulator [Candidatus Angelobacter sp.]